MKESSRMKRLNKKKYERTRVIDYFIGRVGEFRMVTKKFEQPHKEIQFHSHWSDGMFQKITL